MCAYFRCSSLANDFLLHSDNAARVCSAIISDIYVHRKSETGLRRARFGVVFVVETNTLLNVNVAGRRVLRCSKCGGSPFIFEQLCARRDSSAILPDWRLQTIIITFESHLSYGTHRLKCHPSLERARKLY